MAQMYEHDSSGNIRLAFFLNLGFTLFEVAGGLWTNSLAILSDSIHDLGDGLALGIAWYLDRYSRRGEDSRYSYGYRRFSLLSAVINALILIASSLLLLSRAIPRLIRPQSTNAQGMALFAVLGIVVNGAAALRLRHGRTMNERVVAWHLIEDVLGWVAVLTVSVILLFVQVPVLDAALSIAITVYVLFKVSRNLQETLSLFLQAVPKQVDLTQLTTSLLAIEKVRSVHHTHVWSLDGEHHILTTHVIVDPDTSVEETRAIKGQVRVACGELNCIHTTVEIEYGEDDCPMAGVSH